jgi:NitT/TauT family transport system permease protein
VVGRCCLFGQADGLSARFSPAATLASLVELLGQGEVYGHIWVSLKRILVGLLLALLMGCRLGLLVAATGTWRRRPRRRSSFCA